MAKFVALEFVETDGLAFEAFEGTGLVTLSGEILCQGRIAITVDKTLKIVDGNDRNALVQTIMYSYNARIRGVGNILRYCSPHSDHNTEHHVHRFDVLAGDRTGTCTLHGEDGWPTLAEVIEELRKWYWENYDRIEGMVPGIDDVSPFDE